MIALTEKTYHSPSTSSNNHWLLKVLISNSSVDDVVISLESQPQSVAPPFFLFLIQMPVHNWTCALIVS